MLQVMGDAPSEEEQEAAWAAMQECPRAVGVEELNPCQ